MRPKTITIMIFVMISISFSAHANSNCTKQDFFETDTINVKNGLEKNGFFIHLFGINIFISNKYVAIPHKEKVMYRTFPLAERYSGCKRDSMISGFFHMGGVTDCDLCKDFDMKDENVIEGKNGLDAIIKKDGSGIVMYLTNGIEYLIVVDQNYDYWKSVADVTINHHNSKNK